MHIARLRQGTAALLAIGTLLLSGCVMHDYRQAIAAVIGMTVSRPTAGATTIRSTTGAVITAKVVAT